MTYIAWLFLIAAGGGLVYMLRGIGRGNPASLGLRLARYGLAAGSGAGGATVSQLIAPAVRQQSEQGAVSRRLERAVGGSRFGAGLALKLERADMKMTPGEWFTICSAVVVIAALVGVLVFSVIGLLAGLLIGLAAPQVYIRRRINKRKTKFQEQLADMAQMMGNSMRAGFSIMQSMELVGTEGPDPAKQEFDRVVTEVKLGLPLESALEHMLQRMPSEDLELMIVAINVQRQVGGNLAEILMIMAKLVRERVRFQRDLRTLTAQARLSSWIITALPIGVGVLITIIDTKYESYLYTSTLGHAMLGVAITMICVGFFLLSQLAKIEV
jgi:tight adherence protein B